MVNNKFSIRDRKEIMKKSLLEDKMKDVNINPRKARIRSVRGNDFGIDHESVLTMVQITGWVLIGTAALLAILM